LGVTGCPDQVVIAGLLLTVASIAALSWACSLFPTQFVAEFGGFDPSDLFVYRMSGAPTLGYACGGYLSIARWPSGNPRRGNLVQCWACDSPCSPGSTDWGIAFRQSMKPKAAILLFLLALGTIGCSAVRGSGDVINIEVPVENISRLVVSHSFEVNVTVGEEPSLTLRVDDNLQASLSVGVTDNVLRIGLQPRTTVTNATLEADVTITSLEAIEGSGAVDIHLGLLSGSNLDLVLSGASELDGAVEFESMTGQVSGASNLSLSGRVGTLDIEASDASDLSLLELEVDHLRIVLSGASDADITVNDSIKASLSGASSLGYRGDPDVDFDVSGASSIGKITEPG